MLSAGLNIRMLPENTSLPYTFTLFVFQPQESALSKKRHCTFSISLWNVKVKLFLKCTFQPSNSSVLATNFFCKFSSNFQIFSSYIIIQTLSFVNCLKSDLQILWCHEPGRKPFISLKIEWKQADKTSEQCDSNSTHYQKFEVNETKLY